MLGQIQNGDDRNKNMDCHKSKKYLNDSLGIEAELNISTRGMTRVIVRVILILRQCDNQSLINCPCWPRAGLGCADQLFAVAYEQLIAPAPVSNDSLGASTVGSPRDPGLPSVIGQSEGFIVTSGQSEAAGGYLRAGDGPRTKSIHFIYLLSTY